MFVQATLAEVVVFSQEVVCDLSPSLMDVERLGDGDIRRSDERVQCLPRSRVLSYSADELDYGEPAVRCVFLQTDGDIVGQFQDSGHASSIPDLCRPIDFAERQRVIAVR